VVVPQVKQLLAQDISTPRSACIAQVAATHAAMTSLYLGATSLVAIDSEEALVAEAVDADRDQNDGEDDDEDPNHSGVVDRVLALTKAHSNIRALELLVSDGAVLLQHSHGDLVGIHRPIRPVFLLHQSSRVLRASIAGTLIVEVANIPISLPPHTHIC